MVTWIVPGGIVELPWAEHSYGSTMHLVRFFQYREFPFRRAKRAEGEFQPKHYWGVRSTARKPVAVQMNSNDRVLVFCMRSGSQANSMRNFAQLPHSTAFFLPNTYSAAFLRSTMSQRCVGKCL